MKVLAKKQAEKTGLYIFRKVGTVDSAKVHHFFPHWPHILSAGSETPGEKEGSPVLGVPIKMYCNSFVYRKKYCKV
jgi:hypothetical protein